MKKLFKVLATAAAVAAVLPFHGEGDERGGEIKGLLWKASWTRDPDYQSDPEINITIGFNNPFQSLKKESEMFADELVVDYSGSTNATVIIHDEENTQENGCACQEPCQCEQDHACEDESELFADLDADGECECCENAKNDTQNESGDNTGNEE